ncbi:major facilitator superfamily domain-containing protein [Pseudomassariella vexata]|uniref:Major facilitator superfamily domain-containing protein n=1 Tax=Pseudomassariella vexata TaxID=1141098 RepID=A0A1Y2DNK8_9PEZI|nr:major facilitator superfamily domain-containing protein [Pseudomassariella vexata]ORY60759.1 major facilitator superfamily domain-containing protein [Pseudomassariella vexata]
MAVEKTMPAGKYEAEMIESLSIREKNDVETVPVGDYSGAVKKTDPLEIKLVRKLEYRIMPMLWAMYFMNYLDRNAIANARLNGLEDDLHLEGTQYNTCISIFFVGYLLMQIPSNMLMSSGKIRPSWYMCTCMAAWAIISALTALVQDYKRLVVVRFFLGIAEAPFYAGALYLLSVFYTRKEIATRISILYSGNIFATAFAGLIAAATFETLNGAHGIKGWRWLFIIEGVVTLGVAAIGIILLPDTPLTTSWLTPEERQLAHDRIQRDTVGGEESKGSRAGLMQAIKDPRLYLLCFMQNMHLSACSFNNFFPTVVGSLGFSSTITLVLTCPPYLLSGFFGYLVGWTSGRYNERTGTSPSLWELRSWDSSSPSAVNSVILGWVSATLGQTRDKKAVSLSIVNVVANASYIYTAYLYPKNDGPRYLIAMSSNCAFAFLTIASAWVLRFWFIRTNNKSASTDGLQYAY